MEVSMYAFKMILLIVLLLIVAVLIYAAFRPNYFRLERSTLIKTAPEKIFPLLNDFHAWTAWSPWENIDTDLKRTYAGAPAGVGAIYSWEGKKTGQGRMEMTESNAGKNISLKLDFIKPFKASNITDFALTPQDGGTRLNWAMHGPLGLMQRVMHIFFNMEKMVGPDFEKGLASLKALAEK
jgi:carbon monoxide dehydrogenase subunit G